jgi:hypothetical protein
MARRSDRVETVKDTVRRQQVEVEREKIVIWSAGEIYRRQLPDRRAADVFGPPP